MQQNATRAYIATQVTTTTQADLLIMLYDAAVKYLAQAKERIAERDVKAKGQLITKALDIINELQSCLNKEKGGEIADNLSRLYFYCNSRLLMANLKMDTEAIDQVVNILRGLRSAYAEIKDTAGLDAAMEQVRAAPSKPMGLGFGASATAAAMKLQAGKPQPGARPETGEAESGKAQPSQVSQQVYGRRGTQPQARPAPQPAPQAEAAAAPAATPQSDPQNVPQGIPQDIPQDVPQDAPQQPLQPQAAPRPAAMNARRAAAAYGSTPGN
ncbi:flagellar protein FliS [Desulfovibrio sp. X2]|uniref:flagellar export chaperone FliS n=1 Tax=Desulfovibrio sp. X2 TaxID=941449 RepID=UPI00035887BC|nr:flagellar export chaperone FliS [Desulfovibrio sp. X2]EPR44365.1 flagellar protein FliS [Desulfovibrio sp. X2]